VKAGLDSVCKQAADPRNLGLFVAPASPEILTPDPATTIHRRRLWGKGNVFNQLEKAQEDAADAKEKCLAARGDMATKVFGEGSFREDKAKDTTIEQEASAHAKKEEEEAAEKGKAKADLSAESQQKQKSAFNGGESPLIDLSDTAAGKAAESAGERAQEFLENGNGASDQDKRLREECAGGVGGGRRWCRRWSGRWQRNCRSKGTDRRRLRIRCSRQ